MSNPFNIKKEPANVDVSQVMNNPMVQMLRGKGMSYESIVRYICNQRGLNYDDVMRQASAMMGNNGRF